MDETYCHCDRPTPDQVKRYKAIRVDANRLEQLINQNCPNGRERALALTNLEQAVMWATTAITNEK